jgi:hypothetical protein
MTDTWITRLTILAVVSDACGRPGRLTSASIAILLSTLRDS